MISRDTLPLNVKRLRPPNELKHCRDFLYLFINCCFSTVGGQTGAGQKLLPFRNRFIGRGLDEKHELLLKRNK